MNNNTLEANWKVIRENNNYMISDDGRVYSMTSKRLLKIQTRKDGYQIISLWKNNKGRAFYIHRLVLTHFGEKTENETVNHKDGNKTNNHISNLEWMSYADNNRHARETGLCKQKKNNPSMSIPVEQRDLEGNLIKVYPSMRQAERETGVDATSIGHGIRRGWKYGGYKWSFAER